MDVDGDLVAEIRLDLEQWDDSVEAVAAVEVQDHDFELKLADSGWDQALAAEIAAPSVLTVFVVLVDKVLAVVAAVVAVAETVAELVAANRIDYPIVAMVVVLLSDLRLCRDAMAVGQQRSDCLADPMVALCIAEVDLVAVAAVGIEVSAESTVAVAVAVAAIVAVAGKQ